MTSVAGSTHLQGAKIALICGADLVAYLRDDFDHIPNPNEWDLPGGVREDGETALTCALRETREEFGITVPAAAVVYEATYHAAAAGGYPDREVAFFVATLEPDLVAQIVFGDEGRAWRMMGVEAFATCPTAVAELRGALRAYLGR